jgi:hypothetical protein
MSRNEKKPLPSFAFLEATGGKKESARKMIYLSVPPSAANTFVTG